MAARYCCIRPHTARLKVVLAIFLDKIADKIAPGVGEDELLEVVVCVGDVGGLDPHAVLQQAVHTGLAESPGRASVPGVTAVTACMTG